MKVGDTVRIKRPNVSYNNYLGRILFEPNKDAFIVELEGFSKAGNDVHVVVPKNYLVSEDAESGR